MEDDMGEWKRSRREARENELITLKRIDFIVLIGQLSNFSFTAIQNGQKTEDGFSFVDFRERKPAYITNDIFEL